MSSNGSLLCNRGIDCSPLKSALVSTKLDSMILTVLRVWRGSMVNGWADKDDDARFEVYWSNYP